MQYRITLSRTELYEAETKEEALEKFRKEFIQAWQEEELADIEEYKN